MPFLRGDPASLGVSQNARTSDGYCAKCKSCVKKYQSEMGYTERLRVSALRRYYHNRPEIKERMRQRSRITKYGVSPEIFAAMVAAQGGTCALCENSSDLCVDHDHNTGRVRGALCRKCNSGIGLLREDTAIMARAIQYVTSGGAWRDAGP